VAFRVKGVQISSMLNIPLTLPEKGMFAVSYYEKGNPNRSVNNVVLSEQLSSNQSPGDQGAQFP
jgi:hypothetical protein